MNLLSAAVSMQNVQRPPVWMMRQAGRYHSHYQGFRKKYSFIDLCKLPEVACEVTLGPVEEFGFDAAILFSDLLFPLEAMGMGLKYEEGPKLSFHLRELSDLKKLQGGAKLVEQLAFQGDALKLIRKRLPSSCGLLGFVGGPLTLYCYAVEGSHQGQLDSARGGFIDGRLNGFFELLSELLVENMVLQANSGADAVAVLDTCAGEFSPEIYREWVVPQLAIVLKKFKERCPHTPVVYYSKGTGPLHWAALKGLPISCLGIDWKNDLVKVLSDWSETWAIQGNVDPSWLLQKSKPELEILLRKLFFEIKALPAEKLRGWICGLGHGILPKTPEENVHLFVQLQKEMFSL